MPQLNATVAWETYTNICVQQLEAVQRRAALSVKGEYRTTSITFQMLQDLRWAMFEQRQQDAKFVMISHITSGLVNIPASSFLHPLATSTRGHALRYFLPYCRTDTYMHSFFPSHIRLWNQLQSTSPCQRSWRTSIGVWPPYTSYVQDCFYAFNLHCFNCQSQDIHSPDKLRDHDIVAGTWKVVIPPIKKPRRKVHLYQKGDYEPMRRDAFEFAKEKYFNGYPDTCSVKENFNLITSFIQDSADKHIPSKTSRTVSLVPWITSEIRRKICLVSEYPETDQEEKWVVNPMYFFLEWGSLLKHEPREFFTLLGLYYSIFISVS